MSSYIQNYGFTKTLIQDNNNNINNEIQWKGDYDGKIANIDVDINDNGNRELIALTPTKDPYQDNNAILYETPKSTVVFNGNSGLTFIVQPITVINFQFYTVRISNQGNLHAMNYLAIEKAQNVLFFKEYKGNI